MTIIPGIVKSTANILGGGRTQWANFYNACFLLTFLLLGHDLIDMVPMAVLAAILVFIGYKLCKPALWLNVARVGTEQFVVFSTTVLVTLTTDLLIGIGAGIGVELLTEPVVRGPLAHPLTTARNPPSRILPSASSVLFRNPVSRREYDEGTYHLYLDGPLVCFNLFHVIRELGQLPPDTQAVYLHVSSRVPLVDHTTGESLRHFLEEFSGQDQSPRLVIEGWGPGRGPCPSTRRPTRIALATAEQLGAPQATD